MKTPLRLVALLLSINLIALTYYSRCSTPNSIPSRLFQRSRGYLPQTFLGWEKNSHYNVNVTEATCGVDCMALQALEEFQQDDSTFAEETDAKNMTVVEEVVVVEEMPEGTEEDDYHAQYTLPTPEQGDKIIIMGKMSDEYTDWVEKELPDWQRAIYHVDYSTQTHHHANLTSFASSLPPSHYPSHRGLNKGREALPYLTYIIDNYASPSLPSTLVFIHPHRDGYPRAWHTDSPGHSMPALLQALKLDYVQDLGYTNLRCNLDVGCPAEVRPLTADPTREPEAHMAEAWRAIFPERADAIPAVIAAPCCAQFAVSRDAVRARPLADYVRIRDWLVNSEWDDYVTGRVMEYLWHVVFRPNVQDPGVLCPDMGECYCRLYGRMCGRGRAGAAMAMGGGGRPGRQGQGLNTGPPPGVQGINWFPVKEDQREKEMGEEKKEAGDGDGDYQPKKEETQHMRHTSDGGERGDAVAAQAAPTITTTSQITHTTLPTSTSTSPPPSQQQQHINVNILDSSPVFSPPTHQSDDNLTNIKEILSDALKPNPAPTQQAGQAYYPLHR